MSLPHQSPGTLITATIYDDIIDAVNANTVIATALGSGAAVSWTPTEAHISFASASGRYVKIGKLVVAFFALVWPSTGDTNPIQINGIPAVNNFSGASAGGGYFNINTFTSYDIAPQAQTGGSSIWIYDSSIVRVTNTVLTGIQIQGFVVYEGT